MPPSELLVMPSFDFLAKLEHQRLLVAMKKEMLHEVSSFPCT